MTIAGSNPAIVILIGLNPIKNNQIKINPQFENKLAQPLLKIFHPQERATKQSSVTLASGSCLFLLFGVVAKRAKHITEIF